MATVVRAKGRLLRVEGRNAFCVPYEKPPLLHKP